MEIRKVKLKRETKETLIGISLNLDGEGNFEVETDIPFFNHMLELLAKHALFDLNIKAEGDLEVDPHHTVEDVGISLGQAFRKCLGEKRGIKRFGFSICPMDEALSLASVDISGRSHLISNLELPVETIGNFNTELVWEFLHSFVNHAALTLHLKILAGKNTHHIIEAAFKALAKALQVAVSIEPRMKEVPSTKGQL